MKKSRCVSLLLAVLLLAMPLAIAEEPAHPGILDMAYNGYFSGQDEAALGIVPVDYSIENEYGTLRITQVQYTGSVVRCVAIATPKDPNVRFFHVEDELPEEDDGYVHVWFTCYPDADEAYRFESANRAIGESYAWYCSFPVDDTFSSEPSLTIIWHLWNPTDAHRWQLAGIPLEKADIGTAYTFELGLDVGGVALRRAQLYLSPMDTFVTLRFEVPSMPSQGRLVKLQPDEEDAWWLSRTSSLPKGIAHCEMPTPKDAPPAKRLVLSYPGWQQVLAIDIASGTQVWQPLDILKDLDDATLHVEITDYNHIPGSEESDI